MSATVFVAFRPVFEPHVLQLSHLICHSSPLVCIDEPDDTWIRVQLEQVLAAQGGVIESIDVSGRSESLHDSGDEPHTRHFDEFLREAHDESGDGPRLLWLRGASAIFKDASRLASLKALVVRIETAALPTRILASDAVVDIPIELRFAARKLVLDPPRRDGGSGSPSSLESLIRASPGGQRPSVIRDLEQIASQLEGLTAPVVCRVLAEAGQTKDFDSDPVQTIRVVRKRFNSAGTLVAIDVEQSDTSRLSGLGPLRRHFSEVSAILSEIRANGPRARHCQQIFPRGVFLLGLPGCGKSQSARVAAAMFNVPLFELRMGRVMDKFVGSSEQHFDDALAVAEASAPCVLLIDEIARAFGGTGGETDGGTSGRLLARLLGWLDEEREAPVYMVATANRVDGVPPELLRRGRVDAQFFVGLPTKNELVAILMKKLREVGTHWIHMNAVSFAADHLQDFSGADVEALVRAAARHALVADNDEFVREQHMLGVIEGGFRPHAKQWKGDYDKMRKQAEQYGFANAGSDDVDSVEIHAERSGTLGESGGDHLPLPLGLYQLATKADRQALGVLTVRRQGAKVIADLTESSTAAEERSLTTYEYLRDPERPSEIYLQRNEFRRATGPREIRIDTDPSSPAAQWLGDSGTVTAGTWRPIKATLAAPDQGRRSAPNANTGPSVKDAERLFNEARLRTRTVRAEAMDGYSATIALDLDAKTARITKEFDATRDWPVHATLHARSGSLLDVRIPTGDAGRHGLPWSFLLELAPSRNWVVTTDTARR